MSAPDVSVVVPVRDGGEGLLRLVEALRAQTLPAARFEVVIGDDGSRDGATDAVAEGERLRVLRGGRQSSYAARNRAARASRGAVIAFCDADCTPHPDWLERGLAALDAGADLAAGEIRLLAPERPNAWSLLDVDCGLDQTRWVARGYALTANLFVRRELYDAVDGFDERFPSGGDLDFTRRCIAAGARLVSAPAAIVDHPTCTDAGAFLRRAWFRDRNWAARKHADGEHPSPMGVLGLVPVAGPLAARARLGRPLGVDRAHLERSGIRPGLAARCGAVAVMYLVMPYLSAAAHLWSRRPPETRVDEGRERAVQA